MLTTPADTVQSISSQCLYVLIMYMCVRSFHFSLFYCFHSRLVHGLWCAFVSHLSYILSFCFIYTCFVPSFNSYLRYLFSSFFVYTCICMFLCKLKNNRSFSTVKLCVIVNLKNNRTQHMTIMV